MDCSPHPEDNPQLLMNSLENDSNSLLFLVILEDKLGNDDFVTIIVTPSNPDIEAPEFGRAWWQWLHIVGVQTELVAGKNAYVICGG